MLTLERREGESIILLVDDIRIEVQLSMAVNGKAKLSIDAPPEVIIQREELSD